MTFTIRALSALPVEGAPAIGFSATGRGLHSEGFAVAVTTTDGSHWTGNFVRGMTRFDFAAAHPNSRSMIVIAGGQGYIVDPESRTVSEYFGAAITGAFAHPSRNWLVLNDQGVGFLALGESGWVWASRRISHDGFKDLAIVGTALKGNAWEPGDSWIPFELDLDTGEHFGGSYIEQSADV